MLKGTKIGCREGDCGACTVLLGELKNNEVIYKTITSCLTPLGNVNGRHVVTIEGLSHPDNIIQLNMISTGATQCGFCTPGFVVSLTAAAINKQNPVESLDGNICRCTGYNSIKIASQLVFDQLQDTDNLLAKNIVPQYFANIPDRLGDIKFVKNTGTTIIGGGTDLYVQKQRVLLDKQLEFSTHNSDLRYIIPDKDSIRIGAGTTMSEFISNKHISELIDTEQLKLIASTPVRNIATIAGNLVNASPIGDFSVILLALNAKILITNSTKNREISLDEFFVSYKKINLQQDEMIIEIKIPKDTIKFNFEKVSKRMYLDIASVNSACAVYTENNIIRSIRISAGGVYEIPLLLRETAEYMIAKELNEKTFKEACSIAVKEIKPISDVRGSKEYKTLLLQQLIKAHLIQLEGQQ